ncbi:hypothetical protein [Inquilinus sp. CAU 1745]|uniref:hypothetical protein n=1 Tax=Inquilinus sp. CAU 1745 TaxID=3140369 RepID=UPI00325AFEFF
MGGTVASLKGHIEVNGGKVIGCTTLTESQGSRWIALPEEILQELRAKHEELDDYWKEAFGYGLECLTRPEAGYLFRTPTFVRIRDQIAKAAKADGG